MHNLFPLYNGKLRASLTSVMDHFYSKSYQQFDNMFKSLLPTATTNSDIDTGEAIELDILRPQNQEEEEEEAVKQDLHCYETIDVNFEDALDLQDAATTAVAMERMEVQVQEEKKKKEEQEEEEVKCDPLYEFVATGNVKKDDAARVKFIADGERDKYRQLNHAVDYYNGRLRAGERIVTDDMCLDYLKRYFHLDATFMSSNIERGSRAITLHYNGLCVDCLPRYSDEKHHQRIRFHDIEGQERFCKFVLDENNYCGCCSGQLYVFDNEDGAFDNQHVIYITPIERE